MAFDENSKNDAKKNRAMTRLNIVKIKALLTSKNLHELTILLSHLDRWHF